MNKYITTTILAAALSATAHGFTIDFTDVSRYSVAPPTTIGNVQFDVPGYGLVTLTSSGGDLDVTNGFGIELDQGEALIVSFPTDITFNAAHGMNIGDIDKLPNQITVNSANNMHEQCIHEIDFDAVPEPSSTALLGLGAIGLVFRRRK